MYIKEFRGATAAVTTIRPTHYRAEVTERRSDLTTWADFETFEEAKAWADSGAGDYGT